MTPSQEAICDHAREVDQKPAFWEMHDLMLTQLARLADYAARHRLGQIPANQPLPWTPYSVLDGNWQPEYRASLVPGTLALGNLRRAAELIDQADQPGAAYGDQHA